MNNSQVKSSAVIISVRLFPDLKKKIALIKGKSLDLNSTELFFKCVSKGKKYD